MENVTQNDVLEQSDLAAIVPENLIFDDGFMASDAGVFQFIKSKDGGAPVPVRICDSLEVVAQARDENGEWGMQLKFKDLDGQEQTFVAARRMLAGRGDELTKELLGRGFQIEAEALSGKGLVKFLISRRPRARARVVTKTGWHDGDYILPKKTFGKGDAVIFEGRDGYYSQKGTLEGWRNKVAALCVENPLLMFNVSAAFAGPLLKPSGMGAGGFHFYGGSSQGKTTGLKASASPWGYRNFIQQWRGTSNGFEGLAVVYNDNTMPLDEMKQARPQEVENIIYMMGNGKGKSRANKFGDAREVKQWNLIFLSTGEITLAHHAATKPNVGAETRFAEIPIEGVGGMFPNLHGFSDAKVFADTLALNTQEHYGTAGPAFLEELTSEGCDALENIVREVCIIQQLLTPKGAGAQVGRVADRFALVAVAGEYATQFGITGWQKGDAVKATQICFNAWLVARGGIGDRERVAVIEQVTAFLQQHGFSRFVDIETANTKTIYDAVGFKETILDGQILYWVYPETFEKEVCSGFSRTVACDALLDVGILQPANDGSYRKQKNIKGIGNKRYYCLTLPDEVA